MINDQKVWDKALRNDRIAGEKLVIVRRNDERLIGKAKGQERSEETRQKPRYFLMVKLPALPVGRYS